MIQKTYAKESIFSIVIDIVLAMQLKAGSITDGS